MSATGSWASPTNSVEQDGESYSDYQSEKQSQFGDSASMNGNENEQNLTPNFAFFDDGPQENVKPYQEQLHFGAPSGRLGDWELVLAESATEPPPQEWPDFFAPSIGDDEFVKSISPQQQYNNPFLQGADDLFAVPPTFTAEFSSPETEIAPTFRAQNFKEETVAVAVAPTFRAETVPFCPANNLNFEAWGSTETVVANSTKESNLFSFNPAGEDDPFAVSWRSSEKGNDRSFDGKTMNEESLLEQQKLWKEQQNKIIAKHLA